MRMMVLASGICLSLSACAGKPASHWDRFVGQPGVEVTESESAEGDYTRLITLPSGVSVRQLYTKDGVQSTPRDESAGGPVLCAWDMHLAMRSELLACAAEGNEEIKAELDAAVERFNKFILENNVGPVTQEELDAHIAKQSAYTGDCAAPFFDWRSLNDIQKKRFIRSLRADVEKTLAEPRPPVMQPCG